jgi:hypothetical protein
MKMNQSKFGQLVGCSQQNISKLITKGVLEKSKDNKLDVEFSLKKLRDFGLLDENDKLIKSRTPKEEKEDKKSVSLPFNEPVPYKTYADLTDEEKEEQNKEELEAFLELEKKKKEAQSRNIKIEDEDDNLRSFNYASSKAHREHYLGLTAELDHKIKLGEYIARDEAETTFFEAARGVRDSLLSLPTKLAPRIIGKTDIREIQDILMDEIQYVLGNLSK